MHKPVVINTEHDAMYIMYNMTGTYSYRARSHPYRVVLGPSI